MLYDGLLRVPCLVQGPGIPKGVVVDDPIGTVDVLCNAAEFAQLEAGTNHGQSWSPLWSGTGTRDFALSEYEVDAQRSAVDMDLLTVRSRTHRMSIDLRTQTGEIYDMEEDPFEMHNLFDDPSRRAIRQELTDMIRSRPEDIIPAAPRVGWH